MAVMGRPLKYESPKEMQRIIDLYFIAIRSRQAPEILEKLSDEDKEAIEQIEDTSPTISGLAYVLDMTTETLRSYGEKNEFSATVKRAKQRVERYLEQRLDNPACTGTIFNLKNNFGWKDKTEQTIGGDADNPLETRWTVTFVNPTGEESE